jgi:hypothetical protein
LVLLVAAIDTGVGPDQHRSHILDENLGTHGQLPVELDMKRRHGVGIFVRRQTPAAVKISAWRLLALFGGKRQPARCSPHLIAILETCIVHGHHINMPTTIAQRLHPLLRQALQIQFSVSRCNGMSSIVTTAAPRKLAIVFNHIRIHATELRQQCLMAGVDIIVLLHIILTINQNWKDLKVGPEPAL